MTAVGLIGFGGWGRHILRDLVSLECMVFVATPRAEDREAARAAGAAQAFADLDELPAVDGYVVAAPSAAHAEIVELLLPRGPIFVEKPLATSVAAARGIVARGGDRVFVMHKWRYHPGVLRAAEIARSGALGEVIGVACTRRGWVTGEDRDASWRLLPHDLSIAWAVLGGLPAARCAVASGDCRQIFGVLGEAPWVVVEASSVSPVKRREVRVFCRDGVLLLDESAPQPLVVVRGGGTVEASYEPAMALLEELREMVGYLRGGRAPRTSAAEGLAVVEAIAALRALAGVER
jgi:predicted dehydrogenase